MNEIRVMIPGTFTAVYRDGAVSFVFEPAASFAGYFGPAAIVDDDDEVAESLDVQNDDGALWTAVRDALDDEGTFTARWEE